MIGSTVLIDANLLVLLVAGQVGRDLVGRHKNLRSYSLDDYDLLAAVISSAKRIFVTPHILTETSNLLGQIGEPDRSRLFAGFRALIQSVGMVEEIHVSSRIAASRAEFIRLGLADSASLVEHGDEITLLTADAPLYVAALSAGRKAVNFNHIRDQA